MLNYRLLYFHFDSVGNKYFVPNSSKRIKKFSMFPTVVVWLGEKNLSKNSGLQGQASNLVVPFVVILFVLILEPFTRTPLLLKVCSTLTTRWQKCVKNSDYMHPFTSHILHWINDRMKLCMPFSVFFCLMRMHSNSHLNQFYI